MTGEILFERCLLYNAYYVTYLCMKIKNNSFDLATERSEGANKIQILNSKNVHTNNSQLHSI